MLTFILAFLVVALAAYVQASVRFAYALLTGPLLQLVAPELVPGPVLFSSLALSYITAWRERTSLDRRGVSLALMGRVPGALLAGLALGLFAARTYDVVFGSLIIVATVVSLWRGGVQPTPIALVGAGFASAQMAPRYEAHVARILRSGRQFPSQCSQWRAALGRRSRSGALRCCRRWQSASMHLA
jgi:uncharacterized membrane protein YfcA